jgi:hypothetical protein
LRLHGIDALTEIAFTGVGGDGTVGGDGDPRVKLSWVDVLAVSCEWALRFGEGLEEWGSAEAYDERARGFQEIAAGEFGVHARLAW